MKAVKNKQFYLLKFKNIIMKRVAIIKKIRIKT